MKKYLSILIIGLMLSLTFTVNSVASETVNTTLDTGITLYVGGSGPGNYSTIKSAINAAQDGDTVFVYDDSSPYYESGLLIDYSIELIGENKYTTIIDGENFPSIIQIWSDNVKISGFTISNSNSEGIFVGESSNIEISDNIIKLNQIYGIDCHESQDIKISENIILNNGQGMRLIRLSGINVIESNNIKSNSAHAISFWGAITIDVKYNNIENNGLFYPFFQAEFSNAQGSRQNWNGNYWGRPLLFPMPIVGDRTAGNLPFIFDLMIAWDKHPAKEPYVI